MGTEKSPEYRPVPGHERYRVSDVGTVQSRQKDGSWRDLKPTRGRAGYLSVGLSTRLGVRTFNVHTLVLTTFVGPRPSGQVCRHRNDDPADNRLENLAWGTLSENSRDAVANRAQGRPPREPHRPTGGGKLGRQSDVWYWVARDAWYTTIDGRRHQLAKGKANKAEARRAFHRLMAEGGSRAARPDLTIDEAADLFLDHSHREHTPGTYEQHRIKLQSLCEACGRLRADELRPSHVSRWLAEKGWSDATRRGAITSVKAALNWCVREKLLDANPIDDMQRPKMTRRTRTLSPSERTTVADAATDDAFRDLLIALAETGARPGELARLEASMIDWGRGKAEMSGKTTRKTGKPRILILDDRMLALCKRLAEAHPTGPLFRNGDGNPWTPNAIRCRFKRLRERTGLSKVVAYTYRHSYVTDGLERGVSPAAMAELVGHSDLKMMAHYGHLDERHDHLRREATRVTGGFSDGCASGSSEGTPTTTPGPTS